MNQSITIQRLSSHLRRIESEISDIRRELNALPKQQKQQSFDDVTITYAFFNKLPLREQMQKLFLSLSVQSESIGAESLQKQMRAADITSNELSQSIIAAREE